MFVRYYLELDLPAARVEGVLLQHPDQWIPGLARAAGDRGDRMLADVGLGTNGAAIRKQVEVELGPPLRFPSKVVLPMAWRATGPEALFPALDADIEIAPLGESCTQLSISARYRPPLGVVGRAVDRLLMHRVAESTVRAFLESMARAIEESDRSAAAHAP